MQNGCFPSKIALHLQKVCYQVPLCEYCQQQSYKAFTDLSICAKMIRVGRSLLRYVKKLPKLTNPLQKRLFPISIRS